MADSPRRLARDLAEHLRYLSEAGVEGIPLSASGSRGGSPAAGRREDAVVNSRPDREAAAESLEDVRTDLGDCRRCPLHATRTKLVFGVGSPRARLMFVGEAPGADEDRKGEPFVGRAGQLLDRILGAMGLRREEVYIANVLKSRPPDNRAPVPEEIAACSPFLFRQIAAVGPEVIVALGAPAAQTLLEMNAPIGKLRGRFWRARGADLMPTYHPAYLLRNPAKKREVWEDMQLVMERLGLPRPGSS